MNHFEVDIQINWPRLKMIINSPRGVNVTTSLYDTALTNFEVQVRNTLQQIVNDIIKRRKSHD
jgi:hypothetical protein